MSDAAAILFNDFIEAEQEVAGYITCKEERDVAVGIYFVQLFDKMYSAIRTFDPDGRTSCAGVSEQDGNYNIEINFRNRQGNYKLSMTTSSGNWGRLAI